LSYKKTEKIKKAPFRFASDSVELDAGDLYPWMLALHTMLF